MKELTQLENQKVILLGNEAIVRGALEAGVQFVATYPGTPASEIGNLFSVIAKDNDKIYFEFSTNEKLAMEAVIGASMSGAKSMAVMKNFGLNVALEPLIPFCYTGSKGPTVIIVADDPSCHSSAQSEENSRGFAYICHIPVLEPSDAQECKDFVKLAFEISEKFKTPVIVRTTTRVAHQKAIVTLGEVFKGEGDKESASWRIIEDKHKFVTMPPRVLEMHKELIEKIAEIRKYADESQVNFLNQTEKTAKSKIGVITSGVSYLHTMEAMGMAKVSLPVLKLGFFYPLPENKITEFLKGLKKVLIVEELDPYLEREIKAIAKTANPKLEIIGKSALPEVGELRPELIAKAIANLKGKEFEIKQPAFDKIKHTPRFCSMQGISCPYWKVFAALKKAVPDNESIKQTVFGGDIGCYMIAALPPTNLYDYMFCMGSSIGIGHGVSKAVNGKQKVIAFMGDGTFFHSGMPALLNAVYNQSNMLVIIVDNRITAMTGHQPNPGMGEVPEIGNSAEIKIEEIIKSFGVKNLKIVDPVDGFDELVESIQDFYSKDGISVIIARRICALLESKQKK